MAARDYDGEQPPSPMALAQELRRSGLLGRDPALIEVRETHASVVLLTSTDAYKLKKPVNLGFLDYSTLRRRALMARREVNLNRRLAPSIYLGVERLVRDPHGRLAFASRGPAIDYLVHMRRLPDEGSLAARIVSGQAGEAQIREVARLLSAFHAAAVPAPGRYGSPRLLRRNTAENLATIESAPLAVWPARMPEEVRARIGESLGSERTALAARVANGKIRDCHGDLRCEHVYFEGRSIHVIDCIEFCSRFRFSDVGLDLAFLVMDLEVLGCRALARALVDEYERASGDDLATLMPLYTAYRATVRAKVAALRAAAPEFPPEARGAAQLEAARYLYAALRSVRGDQRPRLLAVGGLTGTGKTTAAHLLAAMLPATIISADEMRKRLAGLGPNEHPGYLPDEGLYAPDVTRTVYQHLADAAESALRRDNTVILDATYRRRADREALREMAARLGEEYLFFECVAPDDVVRSRLRARLASGGDPWSDGTWQTYCSQRGTFEPLSVAERSASAVLPTDLSTTEQARLMLELLAYP